MPDGPTCIIIVQEHMAGGEKVSFSAILMIRTTHAPFDNTHANVSKERRTIKIKKAAVNYNHRAPESKIAGSECFNSDGRWGDQTLEANEQSKFHPVKSIVRKDKVTKNPKVENNDAHQPRMSNGSDVDDENERRPVTLWTKRRRWNLVVAIITERNLNEDEKTRWRYGSTR